MTRISFRPLSLTAAIQAPGREDVVKSEALLKIRANIYHRTLTVISGTRRVGPVDRALRQDMLEED